MALRMLAAVCLGGAVFARVALKEVTRIGAVAPFDAMLRAPRTAPEVIHVTPEKGERREKEMKGRGERKRKAKKWIQFD